jgi:energy-coupling factor transporter ATP-binding protein EcfA2
MEQASEIIKLVNYIEENLRASHSAGLTFIDPRHLQTRLSSKQNHVVFGRRGAGKSTLVSSLDSAPEHLTISVNLEDYKDISFPNIILRVLRASCIELRTLTARITPWYKGNVRATLFRRRLRTKEKELEELLYEPDKEQQEIRTKATQGNRSSAQLSQGATRVGGQIEHSSEEEVSRSVSVDKLARLQIDLPVYKDLFAKASKLCSHAPIFLILDDFYFVPKSVQPEFVDFFHRLTKGTNLFLKVATIKHRSRLYKSTAESYIGVELGHDVYEIDMDYTLDNFADLQSFMRQLLGSAIGQSGAQLDVESLFGGEAFSQLCLASGGVPRDFLSLFVRLANSVVASRGEKIGKVDVNEEAIANINSKLEALNTDSAGEQQVLEKYLSAVRLFVYSKKRTNAFLVAKLELDQHPQERQAIKELVDLRLIHLVDSNISSAPSDGRRYEAYILDAGLYENSRPRNFTQVEPGARDSKSRKDQLRASPRLILSELGSAATQQLGAAEQLVLTES